MALPNVLKVLKKNPLGTFITLMIIAPILLGFVWALSGSKSTSATSSVKATVAPTKKPELPTLEIFEAPVAVKLPKAGKFAEAKNNQIILEGTQIQTGPTGRAQVVFPAGTVTRIDNNGLITITKASDGPENIVITILKGRVWSRIKKLLGNESYSTETSNLVATVRGTSYGHGLVEGGFDKGTVFKGKVQMTCKKSNDSMEVIPNKKAMVNCEQHTGMEMLDMDSKDKIDEWLMFNKAQDIVIEKRFGKETYSDDDNVLGANTSVTPSPTPKHTSVTRPPSPTAYPTSPSSTTTNNTGSVTATPTPTYTPTPTPTPTSTLTPTPTPPILQAAEDPGLIRQLVSTNLIGSTVVNILAPSGLSGASASIDGGNYVGPAKGGQQSDTQLSAQFSNVSCGPHTITVSSPAWGSTSVAVTISSFLCIAL